MISKEEALHLVEGTSKRQHVLITSVIMRQLAQRLGEDEERLEIVGLLHDLDYDMVQENMTKHGVVAGEILANKLPADSLYAIMNACCGKRPLMNSLPRSSILKTSCRTCLYKGIIH